MKDNKNLTILDVDPPQNKLIYNYEKSKDPWYEDLYMNISIFFEDIYSKIRNIFIGIKNIIVYAPIIYNTREWDYDYLLYLIQFKLKRMSKDMLNDKLIMEYKECSNQMNEVVKNIDNYRDSLEVYEKEHQDELKFILNTKDEYQCEQLCSNFYRNCYKYDDECWNNIWDSIKEYGRGWWS